MRRRWVSVRHTSHPPAPSQREGEVLLAKVFHSTHSFSNLNLYERGSPLPFGKGSGDGLLAQGTSRTCAMHTFIKGSASAVKSKKKGAPFALPIILQSYNPTILLKNDMPHRHRSPTRIVDCHVVNTRCAPSIDVDIRLLTVHCA